MHVEECFYLLEYKIVGMFALQVLCLLNQKLIREVLHDVEQSHLPECRECKQGKQNIIALSLIKYTTQSQTAA